MGASDVEAKAGPMRRATTALWAAAVALLFLVSTPRLAMAGPCADAAPLPGPSTALLGLEVRSGQFSHLRTGGSSTAPVDWSPTATQEPARVPSDVVGPTVVNVNYSGFSEEARTAFQFAVDVWKTHLSSPVPITIDASFEALGPTTLGGASPAVFVRESGSTTAPWYPVALANAVHGAILLPGTPDIVARFSDDPSMWVLRHR
jgi:hypothetical protein